MPRSEKVLHFSVHPSIYDGRISFMDRKNPYIRPSLWTGRPIRPLKKIRTIRPFPYIRPCSDPCIYQHSPDFYSLQRKFHKFSWGLRLYTPSYILSAYIQLLPLIYPSYQYSPDPKISPHYRANIKNFLEGFAPRVQTTSDILPAYIQLCPQTPS